MTKSKSQTKLAKSISQKMTIFNLECKDPIDMNYSIYIYVYTVYHRCIYSTHKNRKRVRSFIRMYEVCQRNRRE